MNKLEVRMKRLIGVFATLILSAIVAAGLGSTPEAWIGSTLVLLLGIGLLGVDLIGRRT